MDLRPQIEKFSRRFAEVETALSDPKAFDNPQRAQELSREYARLKELVVHGQNFLKTLTELEQNRQLLAAEPADSELALMAKEDIARLEADEKRLNLEIQRGILPPDPADSRNTIIEIRAGAGGRKPRSSPRTSTGCTPATPKRAGGSTKTSIQAPRTWAATRK